MPHLDDPVPVPLRTCAVTLEAGAGQHREARHRRGGQRGWVSLGSEAVQHKVSRQEEESLGGGGLGARRSEHKPARVHRGTVGRNLRQLVSVRDLVTDMLRERLVNSSRKGKFILK